MNALRDAHPYEEAAYYLHALENKNQEIGAGMIGKLPEPMATHDFLAFLKNEFSLKVIKHTALIHDKISTVAVCGGAGGFLLSQAIGAKADIFITSDYKYHEYFDADNRIIIADIGHYESEVYTKDLFYQLLSKKFSNIALNLSEINTNPIDFYS
jgi:putative NIF3 family GTP cyclohydrolase 1 type 2